MPAKSSPLLKQIAAQPSIESLQAYLTSQRNTVKVRRALLDELAKVVEYDDAHEWATAVRTCEALAIVGWRDRERVDAISRFNGDCWETYFVNGADGLVPPTIIRRVITRRQCKRHRRSDLRQFRASATCEIMGGNPKTGSKGPLEWSIKSDGLFTIYLRAGRC